MASKLCCTADQESRLGSPDLPNARVSATTSNQPLLSKETGSPNSHFTSARSEELHELRQIFKDAQDDNPGTGSPQKGPRPRSSRRSIYSLHSLYKMTSMRSLLRRKFSKDLPRKKSNASTRHQAGKGVIKEGPDTVVRHPNEDAKQKLKATKDDLRKDLLSDKEPAEGGYDSDAEVLNVVARNIGKSTPTKRPSIHSVEWAPSSGSKSTPGSSRQRRNSVELKSDVQPYQIETAQPLSSRLGQVFSTPDLRADGPSEPERKLRRSHSVTSMGLPKPSPLSPLRLPSLTSHDKDGVPWSEVMGESLRLSQFPAPPRHAGLKPSKTIVSERDLNDKIPNNSSEQVRAGVLDRNSTDAVSSLPPQAIEIRIQQPTSITSPRPSTSVRRDFRENAHPVKDASADNPETRDGDEDEDNHRRSVHLYSMRISHHLRSGSLLSWDQLADAPELPSPPHPFRQRTVSDQSRFSQIQTQLARHERQTSSSGFASNKVPSRWGRVLNDDRDLRADAASSIYSSRPQSPPDSSGSVVNLSRGGSAHQNFSQSSVNLRSLRRSSSFPTDNEETPRPLRRYGVTNLAAVQDVPASTSLLTQPPLLARKNSVADTKVSKFREEFSPSPPRKKLTPSTSFMKFLNPKRLSLRSLSEANLQPEAPTLTMDGPFDTLPVPADRERRQSRSLVSLQAEQKALDKNKGTNHVWNEAFKAHQAEKASMFLPQNKGLAVHASPFRERSGSVSVRRASFQESIRSSSQDGRNADAEPSNSKRPSAPVFASITFDDHVFGQNSALATRRTATSGRDPLSPEQELADVFDKQGDGPDVVGAWGRFPSHTRADRTVSVGLRERVGTRDFALESVVRFASGRDNGHDDDMVDPTFRIPSPPLMPGEKKRKKKVGSGKMHKSHSMTFGRKLIKNYYSGMFKSSSAEFRRHGRGHRSSIASGGMLEHPELELLPEVFMPDGYDGASGSPSERSDKQVVRRHSERHSEEKSKGKLPIGDSMATLRPRRNSSAPNLEDLTNLNDGAHDSGDAHDHARIWSTYYETCVSSFPRPTMDNDFALEDSGGQSCMSSDGKRDSRHFHTMPPSRHSKHSRNASQLSHLSAGSKWNGRPRSLSGVEDDHGGEDKSLVSVRRSTMDLLLKVKEQENTEHERVLSLTRAESRRGAELLAAPQATRSERRMSVMDNV